MAGVALARAHGRSCRHGRHLRGCPISSLVRQPGVTDHDLRRAAENYRAGRLPTEPSRLNDQKEICSIISRHWGNEQVAKQTRVPAVTTAPGPISGNNPADILTRPARRHRQGRNASRVATLRSPDSTGVAVCTRTGHNRPYWGGGRLRYTNIRNGEVCAGNTRLYARATSEKVWLAALSPHLRRTSAARGPLTKLVSAEPQHTPGLPGKITTQPATFSKKFPQSHILFFSNAEFLPAVYKPGVWQFRSLEVFLVPFLFAVCVSPR